MKKSSKPLRYKLKSVVLVFMIIFLALTTGFVAGAAVKPRERIVNVPYSEAQISDASTDTSIIEGVNSHRVSNSKPALSVDELLNKSAKIRADEIASSNKWSHDRPDGTYYSTSVESWQYRFRAVGENLAKCEISTNKALDDWKKSSEHNANMLGTLNKGGDWTKMGVATAWDIDQHCMIYVTHFGR